ncbi:hypothetical protein DFQ26_005884 [Actinomortierella ambigua]|nr:hypothetical protein DFQ26_005884 [Actinomortierella ambigua]
MDRRSGWTWPTKPSKYIGIVDFGSVGAFHYEGNSVGAAPRVNTEVTFSGSSKVTQMTPRLRRWEPRPIGETNVVFKSATAGSLQFLRATNPDNWFPEETIFDIVHQERKDAYNRLVYDPYRGNLCASGRFLGLPVVVSPMGEQANELGISLIHHKPSQSPRYKVIPPRCGLLPTVSPILQVATSSIRKQEEILIRTRESITIVTAHPDAPEGISRIEPEYIRRADQLPAKPDLCSDLTIHAAFSPYIPHQYALVGDRGRVAIWTRDTSSKSTTVQPIFVHDNTSSNNITSRSSNNNNIYPPSSGQEDNTLSYEDYVQRENELDDFIMAVDGMETTHGQPTRGSKRRNLRDVSGGKRVRMETDESRSGHPDMPMLQRRRGRRNSLDIVRNADREAPEGKASDPWHTCSWAAHPCQLILASRSRATLLDFRGKSVETKLYDVRDTERIVAIQEADRYSGQPFQRYLATNLQVLCLDQRMPDRPLISWAHHQGRSEPRGIEVVEMRVGGMDMSTVVTWSERNAYIAATSVTLDTHINERKGGGGGGGGNIRGRVVLGRPQELSSFHNHPQYTNTSAYRDTQYQWFDDLDEQGEQMMSLKPALYGLSWIPQHAIEGEDSEDEEEEEEETYNNLLNEEILSGSERKIGSILARRRQRQQERIQKRRERAGHLSLFQYSATGAIYAQSVDVLPKFSGSRLGYDFASGRSMHEIYQEYRLRSLQAKASPGSREAEKLHQVRVERVLQSLQSQVASWKKKKGGRRKGGVIGLLPGGGGEEDDGDDGEQVEMEAKQEVVSAKEVREHVNLDLTNLVEFLKSYLEMDRETDPRTSQAITDARGLQAKVKEALQIMQDRALPNMTVFELIREVRCLDLPLHQREALKRGIEDYVGQGSTRDNHDETGESSSSSSTSASASASASTSESSFQKITRTWNVKGMKFSIDPSSSEVTVKQLERNLERQYPWPRTVSVVVSDEADASLARSMAKMHVRPSGSSSSGGGGGGQRGLPSASSIEQHRPRSSVVEWPSPTAKLVRHRTIERLAQDLKLSSSLVVKGRRRSRRPPAAEEAQQLETSAPPQVRDDGDDEEVATTSADGTSTPVPDFSDKVAVDVEFQYLFQSGGGSGGGVSHRPGNGGTITTSPTVEVAPQPPVSVLVPIRVKPILQEWVVGSDPDTYKYVPPGTDAAEEDLEEERIRREAQEQEEKLLRLRMRREKRQAKTRDARARDVFHQSNHNNNNNVGGSASLPASLGQRDSGIGSSSSNNGSSLPAAMGGYDDDDFTFSALPTVVSTSHAAASLLREKKKQKAQAAPAVSTRPAAAAAAAVKGDSITRRESDATATLKKSVSFSVPQEEFWGQGGGSSASQPLQMQQSGHSSSLDAILEATEDLPASQEFGSRFDFMSASQPMPGAFGSRPSVAAAAAKKKKKKPRTQGF